MHEQHVAASQRGGKHAFEVRLVRKAHHDEMLSMPPRAGVQPGVHEVDVQDAQEGVC